MKRHHKSLEQVVQEVQEIANTHNSYAYRFLDANEYRKEFPGDAPKIEVRCFPAGTQEGMIGRGITQTGKPPQITEVDDSGKPFDALEPEEVREEIVERDEPKEEPKPKKWRKWL